MRFEEYDAVHLIAYRHDEIESMKKGLKQYRDLLDQGKAFQDDYCVSHFKDESGPVSINDFDDFPALQQYIQEMAYYYDDSARDDIGQRLTTEELFFLCAVVQPELKDDIIKTCQSIIQHGRNPSNVWSLWLTCETAFGIGPLQIVAMRYPEYGYLMAKFLIAQWDEEHMPFHLEALYQWGCHVGVTKDSLKAYCYCDNSIARQQMLGYDIVESLFLTDDPDVDKCFDLLSYLRNAVNGYRIFVDVLSERAKELPLISMASLFDTGGIEAVLKTLVVEILLQHHPELVYDYDELSFDTFKDLMFIDATAEKTIEQLMIDLKDDANVLTSSKTVIEEIIDEEEDFVEKNTKESLHDLLLALDDRDFFVLDQLNQYLLEDREHVYLALAEWLSENKMLQAKKHTKIMQSQVTHGTYLFVAMYIFCDDVKNGCYDELTELVKNCCEAHLETYLLNQLSEHGMWSSRCEFERADNMMPEGDYQTNYVKKVVENYQNWLPIEKYFKTGCFNKYYGQRAFIEAVAYFTNGLEKESRRIGDAQEMLTCLPRRDQLIQLLYLGTKLEGTEFYQICCRALKVFFQCAPVYVVSELAEIETKLKNATEPDIQLSELQHLMTLGLPEEGYWAYQFEFWSDIYSNRHLDEGYAMALLDRLFHGHEMMENAIHFCARSKVTSLIMKGLDIMPMTVKIQDILQSFGINYMMNRLEDNLHHMTYYLDTLIKESQRPVEKVMIDCQAHTNEGLMALLKGYGAKQIDEELALSLQGFYEREEWFLRSCYMNVSDHGLEEVYNVRLLDYVYSMIIMEKPFEIHQIEIVLIDHWSKDYVNAMQRLNQVDYKAFWMSCFDQMFKGTLSHEAVKDLLRDAVKNSNFHGVLGYFDVDIDRLKNYIDDSVKEHIEFVLKIVAH